MQKLKFLKVQFGTEIQAHEIPAFRGGIASKVPKESVLFHNHDANGFRYAYPMIQYKRVQKQPCIICLGEGVERIHEFFDSRDWGFDISGRRLNLKISQLEMKQFTMQVWDKDFHYRMHSWIPLSQEAFQSYQKLDGLVEQIQFLEAKLIGNILSMAKGIGWHIDKQISGKIQEIERTRSVYIKGVKHMAFDIRFKSNVFLPNDLGLGRNVSIGYGRVFQNRN